MTRIPNRAGPARPLSRLALLLLATAIVVGCATPRPDPEPTPDPEVRPDLAELPLEVRASLLLSEARSRPEPDTVRAAIDAVLALDPATPDQLDRADSLWAELPEAERTTQETRLLGARLAAAQRDWALARERLGADDPDDPTRSPEVYRQGLSLHAHLLEQEGQWYQALDSRLRLDGLLVMEPDLHEVNQQRIWGLLAALRPAQREQVIGNHPPNGDAWVSLFRLLRAADTQEEARHAAGQWRERHPSHPANSLLPELLASHPLATDRPGDILVLLPLSGDLGELGNAILDGITRAYYAEGGGNGRLIVRDTRGQPDAAAALYRRGVDSGVARIIGPLRRESVGHVARIEQTVPSVLLNRTDAIANGGQTTLALNPEEDARAVADRAARAGWRHPLVILPEGNFGDRVASAYQAALAEDGRRARDVIRIQPSAGELNAAIGQALGIPQSESRIRDVARRTGLELEGDPQVRADVDHLFIAGTAPQVRRITPHIHFHRASHLPMMATAHVYSGRPNANRDADLNGIVFPDAPRLFDQVRPLGGDQEARDETLPRFVALGMDALRLSLRQEAIRAAPHHQLAGGTGTWSLNPFSHEWIREPAWARFVHGEPQRIDLPGGDA
ncbi:MULTISPECIES: penicillin-binding protein activator [unclassified Thioalkalivibrio]|uniref:penicillin-binding protein activator n=1 Tax=unclassified Thioalkalivibrio TaxID=2621013 RepID=UPI00035E6241|nr:MULTISPECIES: penicillin-binding protein activator [unclassified Thioalkalivibrio]